LTKRRAREEYAQGDAVMNFAQIGRELGISRQMVCHIFYSAIRKLRERPELRRIDGLLSAPARAAMRPTLTRISHYEC